MNDALPLRRVISGGQTGVDRAALDVAIELSIPHGGWCPRGRLAGDGAIPSQYQLRETDTDEHAVRTRFNIRDSDATLIISPAPLTGGTALTKHIARQLDRPMLIVDPSNTDAPRLIIEWLQQQPIATLNVAGPRESTVPGIYDQAVALLRAAFTLPESD